MRYLRCQGGIALVLLAIPLMWLVSPLRTARSAPADPYAALLAAAKAEGKIVVSGPNYDPDDVKVLQREFKKRFGFPVEVISDPGHVRELPARVAGGGQNEVIK